MLHACAGRVGIQVKKCCVYPFGSYNCDASAVTVSPTSQILTLIQPNTTALYNFNLTLLSLSYGGTLVCNFNYTLNFAARPELLRC